MAVEMAVVYQGDLRCRITHGPSGSALLTDAPVDNHGKGEAFSPTDLVGAALASCVLTTMAIVAKRHGIDFTSASATVVKEMITQPSRTIGALTLQIDLPASLSAEQRARLENAAKTCPVHKSLSHEVKLPVTFRYV